MILIVKLYKHAKFNTYTEIISQCLMVVIPRQNNYLLFLHLFYVIPNCFIEYRLHDKCLYSLTNKMHFTCKNLCTYYRTLSKNVN